ncbi:TetR/AcrR family transcriptional regulator [Sinomonas mesophila]|uniref:TetR/AcrR family transcriptional regulator n=1 Tax=Sinomonas mesophila TaxID=1531955 RepID=UPI00098687A3|nr:TetR/AcrR family transcriptional regulator [Sinomonas mesophila]
MTPETLSRREQNKAATRESIVAAALGLARERGLGAFTVEDIAESAGVSRRTFFNYFTSPEEAIAAPTFGFLDRALERLGDRPDEPLLDSALTVIYGLADNDLIAPMAESFLVAHGHEPVARFQLQAFEECREKIVAAIRGRGGADSLDGLYVHALAACVISCGKSALEVWMAERGGDLAPSSLARLRELLTASITHLKSGFAV